MSSYENLEALALAYIGVNLFGMPYYYKKLGKIVQAKGLEGAKEFLESRPTPKVGFIAYMFARKIHGI